MKYFYALLICGAFFCMATLGCREQRPVPAPLATVSKLLTVHGLLGKDVEKRSTAERKRRVAPEVLEEIFVDYHKFDPFLADIYVGFVVGALARYQDQLAVDRTPTRTRLSAGKVTVEMRLSDSGWQIHLGRSIPESIKAKAKLTQARLAEHLPQGR